MPCLHSEEGVAVAVTLIVMTIAFALASVGSVAAMSSIHNAARDSESHRALAVAEAGAEQALRRHNKILTDDAFPCLVLGAGGDLIAGVPYANGWCPSQSGTIEQGNGEGTYTYAVKPPTVIGSLGGQMRMTIISEGAVGETTRRIALDAIRSTGAPAFADGTVIGVDRFEMNGNGTINATSATNSDFVFNGSNSQICGDSNHGVGRGIIVNGSDAGFCAGSTVGAKALTLAPPDAGDVAASNDNGRFFADDTKVGNVSWNASTRTLTMSGNSALTLGGANYSLCRLDMSGNSSLIIAAGATVRVWFDSPESCGQSGGVEQMSMTGNSEILTTGGVPADAGFLFVGSADRTTKVKLAGNGKANEVMVYAPLSEVHISGNGSYIGAIAGQETYNNSNGTISGHDSVLDFQVGVQTAFDRERFIECVGPLDTEAPDQGC